MEKLNIPNLSVLKGGIEVADENAKNKEDLQLPPELAAHPVFGKVFKKTLLLSV